MFAPESGRLMLIIHGAHNMGVTAIAGTRNCKRIISGGGQGMVSEKKSTENTSIPSKPAAKAALEAKLLLCED